MKSRGPTSSNRHKVVCINWWSGLDLRTVEKGSPMITMRLGFPAKKLKDTDTTRWKEGVSPVQARGAEACWSRSPARTSGTTSRTWQ